MLSFLTNFFNRNSTKTIQYISDEANWVLDEIAKSLKKNLSNQPFNVTPLSKKIYRQKKGIFHYSAVYFLPELIKNYQSNQTCILTYFHIEDATSPRLTLLKEHIDKIQFIHTSNEQTKKTLIEKEIPKEKIKIIPIGLDVKLFQLNLSKEQAQSNLGIPKNAMVIGSFQKDGNGWEEGNTPKLIKGPDVFCDVMEALKAKGLPIFVLLTGPARGYVKNRLTAAGIPFLHHNLSDYSKIGRYYRALDLYLVASRLEGGPRAPMECMAAGVPVVTTKVGQMPSLIQHGENGFIEEIEAVEDLANSCERILNDTSLREKFIEKGAKTVKSYDYKVIAKTYYEELYKPFLEQ